MPLPASFISLEKSDHEIGMSENTMANCGTIFSSSCSVCDNNFNTEEDLANHIVCEHHLKPDLENGYLIQVEFKCDFL